MPTDREYLLMSKLAYKLGNEPIQANFINQEMKDQGLPGWRLLQTSRHMGLGSEADYFGIALKKRNEIVIAHRGTIRESKLNIGVDFLIIAGQNPDIILTPCRNFVENVCAQHNASSISMTGHSLGGFLAAYSAAVLRVPAVTFDSLGAKIILETFYSQLPDNSHNVTNYLAHPNLVNTVTEQTGRIYYLDVGSDPSVLTAFVSHTLQESTHSTVTLQALNEITSQAAQHQQLILLFFIFLIDLINTFGLSHSLDNFESAFDQAGNLLPSKCRGTVSHWPSGQSLPNRTSPTYGNLPNAQVALSHEHKTTSISTTCSVTSTTTTPEMIRTLASSMSSAGIIQNASTTNVNACTTSSDMTSSATTTENNATQCRIRMHNSKD